MQDPISKNNAIYYESVKAYPDDYRGVKWESAQSQFLRFKILGGISPLIFNYSILDVGCGLGHLVDYLISRDFKGSYQGIDISYPMIAQAKKRHPNFTFEHNDIEHISEKSVEYVLASGIFAFSDFEQAKHTLSLLRRCELRNPHEISWSLSTLKNPPKIVEITTNLHVPRLVRGIQQIF
jgi:SAM-dependent methyltransferase